MKIKFLLCAVLLLPIIAASSVPVVVVKRAANGTEQSTQFGNLYFFEHKGQNGIIFEFVPESIFSDGFD